MLRGAVHTPIRSIWIERSPHTARRVVKTKRTNFAQDGQWYKGNLHCHTTCSDGDLPPEIIAGEYARRGYDFLAITDHDRYVEHPAYCGDKLLLIPGFELSAPLNEKKGVHLNVYPFGETCDFVSDQRFSVTDPMQTKEFLRRHCKNNLIMLNHPVWSLLDTQDAEDLEGITCMEVLNYASEWLDHLGEASAFWDAMLRQGKRWWGVADDDNHNGYVHVSGWPFELQQTDSFGGWVCVKAAQRTPQAILQAVASGSFYASGGPEIHDFFIEDDWIHITCSPCERIIFTSEKRQVRRKIGTGITEFSAPLKGNEAFVRAVCIDRFGRFAYANPIFLTE